MARVPRLTHTNFIAAAAVVAVAAAADAVAAVPACFAICSMIS